MAVNNELLYEEDEKGQRVVVKSLESNARAYLRFTNRTSRIVDIFWRDYIGTKRHYARVAPGKHRDINTFMTHPWEFLDASTQERYVVNNKFVFRAPPQLSGMMYRTNWNITVTMRALRATAMLSLATLVRDASAVGRLGLPYTLEQELEQLVATVNSPLPNINRS